MASNYLDSGFIFNIKKFAIHDGPGIRTTVFFKGCPLQCWWCHNPESQKFGIFQNEIQNSEKYTVFDQSKYFGRKITVQELLSEILKDELFYDESGGGVTFSGGEPLSQPEFLLHTLQECKKNGIHTSLDTSGYASQDIIEKIIDFTDLFLYDFKFSNNEKHKKYTNVENTIIYSNLKYIASKNRPIYIRIPIIPTINDDSQEIQLLINDLLPLKSIQQIDILPFHKIGIEKYERLGMMYKVADIPEPTEANLNILKEKFEQNGFLVSIGG